MKKRNIIKFQKQTNKLDCPFCVNDEKIPGDFIEQHLIVTLDKSFHYHIHGPIHDKDLMREFILKIAEEAKIEIDEKEETIIDTSNEEEKDSAQPGPTQSKVVQKKKSPKKKLQKSS